MENKSQFSKNSSNQQVTQTSPLQTRNFQLSSNEETNEIYFQNGELMIDNYPTEINGLKRSNLTEPSSSLTFTPKGK